MFHVHLLKTLEFSDFLTTVQEPERGRAIFDL